MEENILRCPVCGRELQWAGNSLICEQRHCFDRARQGYVNLLPVSQKHSKHPGDTRKMVAARKSFLDQGYYTPIAEKTADMATSFLKDTPRILDAGCGEGYYLSCLKDRLPNSHCIGIDISKDAVRYAAVRNKDVLWLTASAAHLPVMNESMDLVLSMFSLSVPDEFFRVLKPGGYYLEITAGREHLMGLKSLIYPQIVEKTAKTAPEYSGFHRILDETLMFPLSLDSNLDIEQLLWMTPHVWRINQEGAQRVKQATHLTDTAQVLFRLYRKVAQPNYV